MNEFSYLNCVFLCALWMQAQFFYRTVVLSINKLPYKLLVLYINYLYISVSVVLKPVIYTYIVFDAFICGIIWFLCSISRVVQSWWKTHNDFCLSFVYAVSLGLVVLIFMCGLCMCACCRYLLIGLIFFF